MSEFLDAVTLVGIDWCCCRVLQIVLLSQFTKEILFWAYTIDNFDGPFGRHDGCATYIDRQKYPLPLTHLSFPWMFSLNSVTKIFVIKRVRTCHLLCKRRGCYHSTSKTHVRDRIFKLNLIHASVIYQISWIQWIPVPFRENSIIQV